MDLLVRPEDLPRLESLLPDLGFRWAGWLGTWAGGKPVGDAGHPVVAIRSTLIFIGISPLHGISCGSSGGVWDEATETDTGGIRHRVLGPAGTALFGLMNNTTDYGLGNLRGCVESLEPWPSWTARPPTGSPSWARVAHARRALAVLEIFRSRFFPASPADLVTRFQPARASCWPPGLTGGIIISTWEPSSGNRRVSA